MLLVYLLYQKLLPRPIPGIPYNKEAAKNLLGDIPSLSKAVARDRAANNWMLSQIHIHNSPIVQIFPRPFSRPWIILADFRETQDICLRRTKEFDRAPFWKDIFAGAVPDGHVHFLSDAKWKAHRRLLQDLMLPAFLDKVAGPAIYTKAEVFIKLWSRKADLANERPFKIENDLFYTALDAVIAFTFGKDFLQSAIRPQLVVLENFISGAYHALDEKTPIGFPDVLIDNDLQSILTITAAGEVQASSPIPRLTWRFRERFDQSLRSAVNTRRKFFLRQIEQAVDRLTAKSDASTSVRSAIDLMIQRELIAAEKGARKPDYFSNTMLDEIFVLVVGGHDTTSSTLLWGVKMLADNPTAQETLRQALQTAHGTALSEKRSPTFKEIVSNTRIPYLDAVIEEIARCCGTTSAIQRVAVVDTKLLGHFIPKGTQINMLGMGPSMCQPAFKIDENLRSPSSQKAAAVGYGRAWDETTDMAAFVPERWLHPVEGDDGGVAFNPLSGPLLTFGLGTRGCYGRKLAYLEMRLFVTLIIWNFELLQCPEELSSYKGVEGVTYKPQQAYVRLRKVWDTE
ncbi:cytochrome P450 monooxygenase [Colletotrichum truncatum]|uniref:Cytochrome P450 monooxygenase n=1 Tax=Colletotrichum truncatum TaxID=5467 RepID=A0ACC3ZFY2_COLTU|nr:cytochrome P450 monooxygenase [Colletotrichum truncatum]KAF6801875.1 cytochrome P450 monooxygenase [Colletotrichum truncatum]